MRVSFDKDKALQVLLYIARHAPIPDAIHLVKIFYFADKEHLAGCGRLLCGESYVKMVCGPVPTRIYDLIKAMTGRGDSLFLKSNKRYVERVISSFQVEGTGKTARFVPLKNPDLDLLSVSDLKAINKSIAEYGRLPIGRLTDKSHDEVWKAAKEHEIPIELIISTLPDSEALLEYIQETA